MNRRQFLIASTAFATTALTAQVPTDKALVAITLDLEMSRNFPTWETTHWDYEKGNLNSETKKYTVEACRRVKKAGGVLHCFAVGRTLEQESVEWLKEIVLAGHPIGNHTYDHVNILATKPEELQFRFQRSPWLIGNKKPLEVIDDNIKLTTTAMKTRLGIEPSGFRTPGGFTDGLTNREDVQKLLLAQGFKWVSSKYPKHAMSEPNKEPSPDVIRSIVEAQASAQPFAYASGLIEVPMSPVSDIGAFRNGRWPLASLLSVVKQSLEWCIDHKACFDFLAHPSCLYVMDPEFKTIDLICDLAKKSGVSIVGLDAFADRVKS